MDAATAVADAHRARHGLGRGGEREQAARFTEACQKELLTAGLDLR